MKKKTINNTISKKITDWINSIEDKKLQELVKRDVIVTGGCIASMFLNENVKDYDIYFRTLETTFKVCEYYSNKMNERIDSDVVPQIVIKNTKIFNTNKLTVVDLKSVIDYKPTINEDVKYRVRAYIGSVGVAKDDSYDENAENAEFEGSEPIAPTLEQIKLEKNQEIDEKYYPVYISTNAITLSNKIQIVLRFYGDPEVIHNNYDFIHCTNYWTFKTGVVTNIEALECLLNKELKYFGSKYPLASILRTKKFINRGWTVNAGQYIKMVFQLNSMDLEDINTLEEQLTGVDIAYMHNLINQIKRMKEEKPDFEIKNYFIDVVEQIFD